MGPASKSSYIFVEMIKTIINIEIIHANDIFRYPDKKIRNFLKNSKIKIFTNKYIFMFSKHVEVQKLQNLPNPEMSKFKKN